MPRIAGTLLDIEHVEPYVDRSSGEVRGDAHERLHILEGRTVYVAKLAPDFPGSPGEIGKDVDLEVTVRAYKDRNGQATISYTAVKPSSHFGQGRRAVPTAVPA